NTANTNKANNQRGTGLGQKTACYECEVQGHFRRECPKLKNNNNHGNQGGKNNASARVYTVGRAGKDPNANVVMGSKDFIVCCDASNKGLGAVLMQREKKELNMRQCRWLELLSDYDCEIRYYPGKANVIADALSKKEREPPLRVRALILDLTSSWLLIPIVEIIRTP
nr:reverse transcriptase domain-containing protein [Tanacetum cinerariifolium]